MAFSSLMHQWRTRRLTGFGRRAARTPPVPMTGMISATQVEWIGEFAVIDVTCALYAPTYYHWWVDGTYMGATRSGQRALRIEPGGQVAIVVRTTRHSGYDRTRNPPEPLDGRRTVEWQAVAGAADYSLYTRKTGENWVQARRVSARSGDWCRRATTDPLDDQGSYNLRVRALDELDNAGTVLAFGYRLIVRYPDQPSYVVTWDPGTGKVTFT